MLPAEGEGPVLDQHAGEQFTDQHGIPADIPARFEPDAGMGLADGRDPAHVVFVKLPAATLSQWPICAVFAPFMWAPSRKWPDVFPVLATLALKLVQRAAQDLLIEGRSSASVVRVF